MVSSDIYGVRSRSNINCRSRTDRLRIPSKFKRTLFYSLAPRCPCNAFSSKLNNLSFVFPAKANVRQFSSRSEFQLSTKLQIYKSVPTYRYIYEATRNQNVARASRLTRRKIPFESPWIDYRRDPLPISSSLVSFFSFPLFSSLPIFYLFVRSSCLFTSRVLLLCAFQCRRARWMVAICFSLREIATRYFSRAWQTTLAIDHRP